MSEQAGASLKRTPLYDLHVELGGKMVPFAGYDMPVQYPAGIMAEHNRTRAAAGLFDVSHMGQVVIKGSDPIAAIERLVPGDIRALKVGEMRYSLFTNDAGGILDDLIITRREDDLFVVINAACKEQDIAHMRANLGETGEVHPIEDRALLALQGPAAAAVMARFAPAACDLVFMTAGAFDVAGIPCFVTRSGYTGEDGFEISAPDDRAEELARKLLAEEEVEAIGLGARDSLRLEAGLCLYGHDITAETTPVEGALTWAIGKRRREEGGFPGAEIILEQIKSKPPRKRVGILPEGRAPAREHTEIADADGNVVGEITSGGFGPTVGGPVAMGYVPIEMAAPGTELQLMVRGKPRAAKVARMPFVEQRYYRG